ncbi:uncharacterized protein LOC116842059 isoform X2 [Odontomachus brunneus]|uniref:uncharacterized protein LOC116842059 isoform X2 n=1 Tax=Odontomachus brunneus TaxID=486640 RepID=UPI0013F2B008|nr:uncharacterized protein LOC116842059 isoform X2 [Odontomachus brunneus]
MCDRQKGTICVVKIETTGKLLYSSVHEHVIGSSNSDRVTAKITCMFVEFYHQENVSELFCKHECTLHLQHNRGITTEARCFSIRVWKICQISRRKLQLRLTRMPYWRNRFGPGSVGWKV